MVRKKSFHSFLLVMCFVVTAQEEAPVKVVFSQERIMKKKETLSRAMRWRMPVSCLWNGTKVGMSIIGAAGVICAISADFGYPLAKSYVPQTPGTWKERIGTVVLSVVGSLGLGYVSKSIDRQYGVDPTIAWFVTTHAPFYETIRALRGYTQAFSLSGELENKPHLTLLYKKLVHQTEHVGAYMMYTESRLSQGNQLLAGAVRRGMFKRLEPLYAQLRDEIVTGQTDETMIVDTISSIIEQACVRFAIIEGSRWVDPQLVCDMMQHSLLGF